MRKEEWAFPDRRYTLRATASNDLQRGAIVGTKFAVRPLAPSGNNSLRSFDHKVSGFVSSHTERSVMRLVTLASILILGVAVCACEKKDNAAEASADAANASAAASQAADAANQAADASATANTADDAKAAATAAGSAAETAGKAADEAGEKAKDAVQ
ncbi:MAG TPA: hypothetical protein VIB82_06280 [Caulobacteraceae bacterium]